MSEAQRLDKWLWYARFYKTRSLAAAAVAAGRIRINGDRVAKPAASLRPGDVLTFALGARVLTVKMLAPGVRRGPAPEARLLYEQIGDAAMPAPDPAWPPPNAERKARVERLRGATLSKKDRRDWEKLQRASGLSEPEDD